ncbi:WhiB family transcriptional regulator [Actinotalea sp. K2]|nr:WhiB family transcriptional regulator [Actinotalea sp. K2]
MDVAPTPCADDPALWFAERTVDAERAKALCQGCPLRVACLEGALARREPWGVWGGEVVVDGVVVATKRGRGRPPAVPRQHARHAAVVRSPDERPVR